MTKPRTLSQLQFLLNSAKISTKPVQSRSARELQDTLDKIRIPKGPVAKKAPQPTLKAPTLTPALTFKAKQLLQQKQKLQQQLERQQKAKSKLLSITTNLRAFFTAHPISNSKPDIKKKPTVTSVLKKWLGRV